MSDFTVQELTLGQLLENTAARFPDTDAVIHADRELWQTWSEFSACVDDMARGLMAIGVQKGEKVAVWATNVPHWVTLMFATARIGAILVTVNTNYRETELRYLLQQSECENLFIIDSVRDHDFIASIYEVLPELRRQRRGMLEVEGLPHLKRVFFLGTDKHRGMYSLPELFSLAGDVSDEEYESRKASISPYDVVNMQYTSGTTGFPKGVMLTHVNIVNNGYWIGYHQKFSSRDRVCLPVPLFHCFGCVLGVMACVNHGATMVLLDAFSPVQVMTAVEQEKCTALYGVPTMFQAILDHRVFSRFDFSSLRTGIMAGSVCPEPLMRRVMDQMCMSEITICYGLTEGSPVMTQTRTDDTVERRVKTVGRSMPGIEVTIRDPETNEEVPRNAVGEVLPWLQRDAGLLQHAQGHGRGHRRRGLAALRRPRHHGRGRVCQHQRANQGYDHPGRRKRIPPRGGGIPPQDGRSGRRAGRGRAEPPLRRRGGRVPNPQGGCGRRSRGCARLLPRQDRVV